MIIAINSKIQFRWFTEVNKGSAETRQTEENILVTAIFSKRIKEVGCFQNKRKTKNKLNRQKEKIQNERM